MFILLSLFTYDFYIVTNAYQTFTNM